jgi:hypothetical protein
MAGVDDEQRHTDGVGEEARRGAAQSFWLHGPARGGPAKLVERSARPEVHWWPAIARRRAHRLRRFGAKSGERKGGGHEQELGVDPVLGAELLQWSRAAGMQWNDRPTAEPKLGAAKRIVATALGFVGGCFGGLGSRGVRGAK